MKGVVFSIGDPDKHGHGYMESSDPPPPRFLVALDRFMETFETKGWPRPYLSSIRATDEGQHQPHQTWTVDFDFESERSPASTGFIEWHDDHAVALDPTPWPVKVMWESERMLP